MKCTFVSATAPSAFLLAMPHIVAVSRFVAVAPASSEVLWCLYRRRRHVRVYPGLHSVPLSRLPCRPMLILERMDCSLRSLLSAGPLSLPTVVTVARAVASALFYLHSLSPEPIVHRDLSSANVLLTSTPSASSFSITGVKLSDFGSAHFVQQCTTTVPGTPIYAAPEVLQSNGPAYLTKSDIYSLGVLLTEMCTGQQPAPERRAQQVRSVRSRNLRALADRCLSTDPAQRPSASAIVDFLDRLRQRMDSQIDHTRQ